MVTFVSSARSSGMLTPFQGSFCFFANALRTISANLLHESRAGARKERSSSDDATNDLHLAGSYAILASMRVIYNTKKKKRKKGTHAKYATDSGPSDKASVIKYARCVEKCILRRGYEIRFKHKRNRKSAFPPSAVMLGELAKDLVSRVASEALPNWIIKPSY